MELMSSVLLCALAALLPHTLGRSEFNNNVEIKRAHKTHRNSPRAMILNMKGTYTNENSVLHTVFEDVECFKCHKCMDRAIKAQHTLSHFTKVRPSAQELHEDLLRNKLVNKRFKRDVQKSDHKKKVEHEKRAKKAKPSKVASVTKYEVNGDVYALKVKDVDESGLRHGNDLCKMYIVKKSITCESPEREVLLMEARRDVKKMKVNKTESVRTTTKLPKTKKPTEMPTTKTTTERTSTDRTPEGNGIFKKRDMDNSEVPEFIPSIEEMTY